MQSPCEKLCHRLSYHAAPPPSYFPTAETLKQVKGISFDFSHQIPCHSDQSITEWVAGSRITCCPHLRALTLLGRGKRESLWTEFICQLPEGSSCVIEALFRTPLPMPEKYPPLVVPKLWSSRKLFHPFQKFTFV